MQLPREGSASVSFAVLAAGLVLFGPVVPVAAAIITGFHYVDIKQRKPLHLMAFNAAQLACASMAMYLLFVALGGRALVSPAGVHSVTPTEVLAVLVAAVAFFATNIGFVLASVSLGTGQRASRVWADNFRWMVADYASLALVGILLAATYAAAGLPGVILLVVPLLIARQTFVVYMRRRIAYLQTVHSLVAAIEAKDAYTRGHSQRVAEYAGKIAEEMGQPDKDIEMIRFAALLHDLGKIGVDRKILNKPGALTMEEYALVKQHPELGAQILSGIAFLDDAVPAIASHHERPDGAGYGQGLPGDSIPMMARILAVADCFDAMTSVRPYRPGLTTEEAVAELVANCGSQFDPDVVRAFLRAMRLDEPGEGAHGASPEQLSLDEARA